MKKRILRTIALLLALCLMATVFVGCSNTDSNEPETTDEIKATEAEKTYKIGFSHCNLSIAWMADLQSLVEKKAAELGVELIVANADNDSNKQVSDVENLIQQGVDGILIVAVDSNTAAAAVEKATEAGIPVAAASRAIESDDVVCFSTGDDLDAGREAGRYCAEVLNGEGKVVLLQGPLGLNPVVLRTQGFKEAIAEYPGIEIVAEQVADNDRATAVTVMENILTANSDIDFVFATNDEMTLGAINAMKAADRLNGVYTITVGGHEETFTSIKNGEMSACVYYPSSMGATALENLVKYLNGEVVDAKIVVPCARVTQENVDEYLEALS